MKVSPELSASIKRWNALEKPFRKEISKKELTKELIAIWKDIQKEYLTMQDLIKQHYSTLHES